MAFQGPQVGEVGVQLKIWANPQPPLAPPLQILDISAGSATLTAKDPNGVRHSFSMSITGVGMTSAAIYTTVGTDFTVPGKWLIQMVAVVSGSTFETPATEMIVGSQL